MTNLDLSLLQIGVRIVMLLALAAFTMFALIGLLRTCSDALMHRPRVVVRNPRRLPRR